MRIYEVCIRHFEQRGYRSAYDDVATNEPFKNHLKESFSSWYAEKVKELLDSGLPVENIKVDLRIHL